MFANATADTAVGIDIGPLEFYHNFNRASGGRRWFKGKAAGNLQPAFPVADDSSRPGVVRRHNPAVIISGGILIDLKAGGLNFDIKCIGPFDDQWRSGADGAW